MFQAPIGRFQLESKLDLPLFLGFTVVLFKYREEHDSLDGTTVKPENKGNSNFDSILYIMKKHGNIQMEVDGVRCSWMYE